MPGHIGQDRSKRKQVFRQLSPTIGPAVREQFFPWRAQTRDAAPGKPATIKAAVDQTHTLERVVSVMADVATRIGALEARRAQQRQLAEQMRQQQIQQQPPTTQPTQDHAASCSCQSPAPQAPHVYRDGATHMDRNQQLAPNRHLTFGAFPNPRMITRDQQQLQYGEKPSRFTSEEADRMARYLPPGSASRVTTKEAVNDMNLRGQRDATQAHNVSGPPQPAMTQGSDLSSAFASELQKIPPGQPIAAQNVLNKHYNSAKDGATRDAIEKTWRDFSSHYDAKGDKSPWAPRQSIVQDAPWTNLYEANKGTIGGDPNKIQVGQQLDLGGGQTHTVAKGETLSGIAASTSGSAYAGSPSNTETGMGGMKGGPTSLLGGGGEPSGGSYSSGGGLKVSEGTGVPGTKLPTTLMGGGGEPSSSPTPSPSGGSGSAQAATPSSSSSSSSETPTPPVKPASLGGTGESPSGLNPQATEGGGASPSGSEGTGLAKMVRGWVTGESE